MNIHFLPTYALQLGAEFFEFFQLLINVDAYSMSASTALA